MNTEEKQEIEILKDKFILDACCGGRMMWFNKNHPNVIYIDNREGYFKISKNRGYHKVKPDFIMDNRKMNFPDERFKLIVFDPPHFKSLRPTSDFYKKFGGLNAETWQSDLKRAFNECWRVLENYGILIFKWNDYEIKKDIVLKIIDKKPLFMNTITGRGNSQTYWFCFMKIPELRK